MPTKSDTILSNGFDAGNYANAYETQCLQTGLARLSMNHPEPYIQAYILGFFSTYTLLEMRREDSDAYLKAYNSPAGKRCLELGYIDPLTAED